MVRTYRNATRKYLPVAIVAVGALIAYILVCRFEDHQMPIIGAFVVIAATVRGWVAYHNR